MGNLVSRLSQLALGDLDSALDPDAYRPKLETEFNTPQSKNLSRVQLPDPRSISRGIDRTPLYGFVAKEEAIPVVNSTPLRSGSDDQTDREEEKQVSVTSLPKRLLETNLDSYELCDENTEIEVEVEPEADCDEVIPISMLYDVPVNQIFEETENSVAPIEKEDQEASNGGEVVDETSVPKETKGDPQSPQALSGSDLLSLRKHLFTTPQQQSIKAKRVPLGYVCPNTAFDALQENPLSTTTGIEKNWKNVSDERYRLGLTASSDPENTPPSVLRLTEPPDCVQSAPGKFKNPSRKRFESRNSPGLFL